MNRDFRNLIMPLGGMFALNILGEWGVRIAQKKVQRNVQEKVQ